MTTTVIPQLPSKSGIGKPFLVTSGIVGLLLVFFLGYGWLQNSNKDRRDFETALNYATDKLQESYQYTFRRLSANISGSVEMGNGNIRFLNEVAKDQAREGKLADHVERASKAHDLMLSADRMLTELYRRDKATRQMVDDFSAYLNFTTRMWRFTMPTWAGP